MEQQPVITDSEATLVPTPPQAMSPTAFPAPPRWLGRVSYWFRIGFSLFLLLSVLLGMIGCSSSAATVPWQSATTGVPEAVLEQVIQAHTDLDVAPAKETLLAWTVDGKVGKLTLFNFNTPKLCGALGCLYVGYWLREYQPAVEVFQNYLNPNLPMGKPLFRVGEERGQVLPCLEVLQMEGDSLRDGKAERLRRLSYCFNGDSRSEKLRQRYQLTDSQLLSELPQSVQAQL